METLVLDPKKSRTSATARILIADDQPDVVEALRFLLKGEGYEAEGVNSPAAVLQAVATQDFDLLLLDLNYTRDTTSGLEGLDLLSRIKASDSILPVVVMTAWGSVELAVEAMHRGVGDFVLKPWNNRQLLEILRTQIEHGASRRRELQEKILAEVAKFTGGRFEDDATLVVVAVASEKSSG
jgi:DNA-binding NtrC family response regulator